MRAYVAGSRHDIGAIREAQAMLRSHGCAITFDWTGAEGEVLENQSDWCSRPVRAREIGSREICGVRDAQLFVLMAPADPHHGFGCFLETGAALWRGVPVCIVGDVRESIFWQQANVHRFLDLPALSAFLEHHA